MSFNRVLITGGAGFIGSHSVELLLNQGKEVVVLDNLSAGFLTNLNLTHPNLEFIEGDVLEFPLIVDLLKECDAILHLAALVSVPQSIDHAIYSLQVNTQGFLHILEAVRKINKPIRIVYASSSAVYGEVDGHCNDEDFLTQKPLSPYALQKLNCEQYADLYSRLHKINSLGLRYFNVYGPNQVASSPYSGVVTRFIDAYRANNDLTVFGDGKQTRDFICVKDVAAVNQLALASNYHGLLNVATGESKTLLELIEAIEQAGQRAASIRFENPRFGDIKHSKACVKKTKEQLKFEAKIKLKEGIKHLLNSFQV